jgi:hypothetical protein
MDQIQIPSVTFIAASPKCGKTHFISSYILGMCIKGRFNHGLIFNGTKGINIKDYQWMPEEFIYGEFNEDVLVRFLEVQERYKDPAFLIFDDMDGKMDFNSNIIQCLFTTSRHYNLTILVATQYINNCPPVIRNCTENFVVFKQFQFNSVQALRRACMGEIKSDQECQRFIDLYCPDIKDHKYILVRPMEESSKKYIVNKAPAKLPNVKLTF